MCYPLTTQEVSEIVKICASYRLPIIPFGSGTSLEGHTQATHGGLCIDVSRMKTIVAIHHADMDVVVQPGLSNEELNKVLKPLGLFYPVDPAPTASIGGMVACSCSGTNAHRYGTMRNNVINVTGNHTTPLSGICRFQSLCWIAVTIVVLPDGTIVKTAQRARKTSAGYNLTGLFIGSEGTLGIVTEATLRLQPIPPCSRVACESFIALPLPIDL
jgi:D-lactate dehydrogenase (cytochrome)